MYLGWSIFVYYIDSEEQHFPQKHWFVKEIKNRFCSPLGDFTISDNYIDIVESKTNFDIQVELYGCKLIVDYEKEEYHEEELYASSINSRLLFWKKRREEDHRKLMFRVFRKIPEKWNNACGLIESDNSISLSYWRGEDRHIEKKDKGLKAKSYSTNECVLKDSPPFRRRIVKQLKKHR